jgi:hypothetical protein
MLTLSPVSVRGRLLMGRGGFILNTQKYYNYSELHLFKVTDIS